jgi:hypothetical protein
MEDISDRIAHLSQELRAFQLQLQCRNSQRSANGEQDQVMDNLLDAGLGQDLKRTVDLLSQFLWCYIEAAAAGANADAEVDYARQSSRLGQITGILRQLHHSSCPLKDSLAFVEHTAMTLTSHVDAGTHQQRLSLGKSA